MKVNMRKGVYSILNLKTNWCYIGSSVQVERRVEEHFDRLRKRKHNNTRLQNAFNLDEKHFTWKLLEEVKGRWIDRDALYDREQFYLDSTDNLYNILLDAKAHLIKNKKKRLKVGLNPRQRKLKL